MIKEPDKVMVDKHWNASIPHIANQSDKIVTLLENILAELKRINNKE